MFFSSRSRIVLLIFFALTVVNLFGLRELVSHYDTTSRTLTFRDRHDNLMGTLFAAHGGLQVWTPYEKIPERIIEKVIHSEDRWFFYHPGINPWAILKAGVTNLARGRVVRGGSTITQQLAKHYIQEKEGRMLPRTIPAKIRTSVLALGLETVHAKKWILEQYLNTAYFGNRAYGIAAAADVYFGKQLDRLNDAETAFLVRAIKRPAGVSEKSVRTGGKSFVGRHFAEWVSQRAYSNGVVSTTLDAGLQKKLEKNLAEMLTRKSGDDPKINAALVVIEVATGDVIAMVGSRGFYDDRVDGQVNAAVALRQPGSTLKPFTYFAAFTRGFTADSLVPDIPHNFAFDPTSDGYMPQNFDRRFRGYVTIREALANSYNIPAVSVLNRIGLSYYHDMLRHFGIHSLEKAPQHYGLSVTLGSGEVTLLELTNAYAALARGGKYLPYRTLKTDLVESAKEVAPDAFRYASEVTRILRDAEARLKTFGYNEALEVQGRDVAVKTGTSYDLHDNWTVGYTPSYAVGVWVGHSDSTPLKGTTGATGAAPLWHAAVETVLRDEPAETFALAAPLQKSEPNTSKPQDKISKEDVFRILKPVAGTRYRLHPYVPKAHQKILAEVEIPESLNGRLSWFLDGAPLNVSETSSANGKRRIWLDPFPGNHVLRVESAGVVSQVGYAVDMME